MLLSVVVTDLQRTIANDKTVFSGLSSCRWSEYLVKCYLLVQTTYSVLLQSWEALCLAMVTDIWLYSGHNGKGFSLSLTTVLPVIALHTWLPNILDGVTLCRSNWCYCWYCSLFINSYCTCYFCQFFTLTFIIYCTFTIPFLKPLSSSRGEGWQNGIFTLEMLQSLVVNSIFSVHYFIYSNLQISNFHWCSERPWWCFIHGVIIFNNATNW